MKQYHAILVIFVFLLLLLSALYVIRETNLYYPIKVTTVQASDFVITGEGQVEIKPDLAYINAGITVFNEPSIESAREKINQANNKIIKSAMQNGIPKEDITTSNYDISPREQFNQDGTKGSTTYYATASMTIKTKDLDKAEQLTTILTQAGANSVNARFTVEDPNKYREQARNEAIKNAKEQAKALASELDIKLGKVTNVVEGEISNPIPLQARTMMAEGLGGASSPDLEPGTQTISTTITLYFEKK